MPQQSNLLGCIWMLAGGLLFVAVTVLVRSLGSDMPAVEAAFIRYLTGVILVLPVAWRMRWRLIARQSYGLYALRGLLHGGAVMLWFYAMARIPIAEVTAIGFSTPVITALGAILLFREPVRIRRMLAIAAGFLGTLVILRPGFHEIEAGALAQFSAAFFFAGSFLLTKKMTERERSGDILVMLSIFCTLALLPGAIYFWRPPTPLEIAWLALVAIFATAGHYAITRAIGHAPLTVTQPLTFLQLVWAVLFGYLLFDEVPDAWVILGAGIVVGAVSYIAHREARAARRVRLETPALPE